MDADTSLLDETAGEYRPQAGPAHCEPDEAGCSGKEKTQNKRPLTYKNKSEQAIKNLLRRERDG